MNLLPRWSLTGNILCENENRWKIKTKTVRKEHPKSLALFSVRAAVNKN